MVERKLILIGLDGFDPDFFKENQDELQNLNKITSNGFFGKLKSTIPPITGPAWTSMMSGKNPGKTGIIDFVGRDPLSKDEGKIFNSSSVETLRLWNVIEKHGRKSIVVGVPVTYPVEEINGIMIGGFMTPSLESKRSCYPSVLKNKLDEIDYTFFVNISSFDESDGEALLNKLFKSAEKRFSIINELLKKEWDFFTFVISETDWLQHFFEYRLDGENENEILKFFKYIDKKVGEIIEDNPEANILITSDHGFGKQTRYHAHINRWLEKKGLLEKKPKKVDSKSFLSENFRKILAIPGMQFIKKIVPKNLKEKAMKSEKLDKEDIKWENTKAYFFSAHQNTGFINVNKSSKIKNEKKLKKQIAEKLSEITDENNRKIVKESYIDEEIYQGPHIEKCPDIAFIFEKEYSGKDTIGKEVIKKIPKNGRPKPDHRMEGIIMGCGPDINDIMNINASIYDIAPTVYALLGIPLPKNLDGKILKEICSLDISKSNEIEKKTINSVVNNLNI